MNGNSRPINYTIPFNYVLRRNLSVHHVPLASCYTPGSTQGSPSTGQGASGKAGWGDCHRHMETPALGMVPRGQMAMEEFSAPIPSPQRTSSVSPLCVSGAGPKDLSNTSCGVSVGRWCGGEQPALWMCEPASENASI